MIRKLIITAAVWLLIVPISMATYFSSHTLPAKDDDGGALIKNSYVLEDALPQEIYNYTMSRVERYHDQHDSQTDAYVIQNDELNRADGKYSMTLEPVNGKSDDLTVDIRADNYGNFFSISVVINGKVQSIS